MSVVPDVGWDKSATAHQFCADPGGPSRTRPTLHLVAAEGFTELKTWGILQPDYDWSSGGVQRGGRFS